MQDRSPRALEVARAYFDAWTSGDFTKAMEHVAPEIVCHAPAGRLEGHEAFAGFMGPFVGILKEARLLAAYGDDEQALLMYDTRTIPVPSAPGAELHTVRDGRITELRIIFDRAPFDAARSQATVR